MDSPSRKLAWAAHPFQEVVRLSWPMVVSLFSMSLMTFVDTLFIGRLGSVELAAAGLGGVCVFTVLSFGMSVFGAAKVKVGEQRGKGDTAGIERSLGAFVRLSVALGVLSVVAGLAAAAALPYVSADDQSGRLAGTYMGIRSLGFPIVLLGHAIGQWLQAQGDSKTPMRAALIANAANAPLNALLIFGLDWGIVGAAVATASSRIVETGYLLWYQKRARSTAGADHGSGFFWSKSSWSDSYRALRVGLPTGLERVLDMIAFAAVPILLSQVGPDHVAAHQIVLQLLLFSFLPLIALSDAISVLVSQAVGAQVDRLVGRIDRLGMQLALGYGVLCGAAFLLFPTALSSLFTQEPELQRTARDTLLVGAVLQLANAPYNHIKGVLRGLSDFRFVAWVTVTCSWIITPPLTYLWGVRHGAGAPGAWAALCVEVMCGTAICLWKKKRPRLDWAASPARIQSSG